MTDFKELTVWQKSMDLVGKIYKLTGQLPVDEKFGLISQVRRCSVSIPSNIAEGSKRRTSKDFRSFLRIASGSAAELETQLLLIKNLYNLDNSEVFGLLKEVQKMLESFIKKL